jgi:hypothetical protein
VKKSLQIFALLGTTILYCFIFCQYSEQAVTDFSRQAASETQSNYSAQTADLFCHTFQTKTVVKVVAKLPSASLKNPFTPLFASIKTSEAFFRSICSSYIFNAENLGIRFRTTDIIFPFHYFW